MIEVMREFKDRVAVGDDRYTIEEVGVNASGKKVYRLIPEPVSVAEPGTNITAAMLRSFADAIAELQARVFDNMTGNPFSISFGSLDGVTVTGIWNSAQGRIEC